VNKRAEGAKGEDLAAAYLERNGYQILERNYRFDRGEIDLIAREGDDLVFIEVKARRSGEFGLPQEAVTPQKEEQLRKVAEGYLFEHQIENQACRFDVVAIAYTRGRPDIEVIRDAF
jgi:putative endonuclease